MKIFVAVVLGIIGWLVISAVVYDAMQSDRMNPHRALAAEAGCNIDMPHYTALLTGMSYRDVTGILGGEGTELSRSQFGELTTSMFIWSCGGRAISAMFQNNRLIMRSQAGL